MILELTTRRDSLELLLGPGLEVQMSKLIIFTMPLFQERLDK